MMIVRIFGLMLLCAVAHAEEGGIHIATTSSAEYAAKPATSIYPAFVDTIAYQSWTEAGPVSFFQLQAEGGQAPYTWELAKGQLPAGMTLNGEGRLSGIATKGGHFAFEVRVTDAAGKTATKALEWAAEPYRSQWMADAKFGLMIQWGAFSEPPLSTKEDIEVFEKRITRFNAEEWASYLEQLGGKVLNFTVKGGDGIRYWPSTTPSKYELKTQRNIVGELIEACHKRGIKFVAYFAPDHGWNKVVNDVGEDGTWGTLNRGLIRELVLMGVDGFWIDMGGTPELFAHSDPKWFPWDEILPIIRTHNPHATFVSNPGIIDGGTVLHWPHADVIVYEGDMGAEENALKVALPNVLKKPMAIEVDNLLDNIWGWTKGGAQSPKPYEMMIKNIEANWAVGATYMLNYLVPSDGNIAPPEYKALLDQIGAYVKAHQGWSAMPEASLSAETLYDSPQSLTLTAAKDAEIRFSTDGTTPNSSYVGPIAITESTRVKAIATEPGKPASKVMDKTFILRASPKNGARGLSHRLMATSPNFGDSPKPGYELRTEPKGYYRGMKFTVGADPIVIDQIGRAWVKGNRHTHRVLIRRLSDGYPLFVADFPSGDLEADVYGFQCLTIPPLTLEAGKSYLVAFEENAEDKFLAYHFSAPFSTPHPSDGLRVTGNAIFSPTGDRKPVESDDWGAVLNLVYHVPGEEVICVLPAADSAAPMRARNLALGSTARLLNNADRQIGPVREIMYADNGVDGDLETVAQATGKYAWTLDLDLGRVVEGIKQAKATFRPKGYPTVFQILTSVDGDKWSVAVEKSDNEEIECTTSFTPQGARYIRLRSLKPDGPDQKGGQMSVREFELYR